jgi:hypothetical protein
MLSPGEKPKGTLQQRIEDKWRLEAMKARMAALPPAQRKRVAERALALHLQRRAGQGPSTYLDKTLAARKNSPTKPVDATQPETQAKIP